MSNRLEITTLYDNGAWLITSSVSNSSDEGFPRNIFLWTLNDDGSLNEFQTIGHIDQVVKYKDYDPNRTSNFGIHLVKTDVSETRVQSEVDRDRVLIVLKKAFDTLLAGYEESTKPVTEVYP